MVSEESPPPEALNCDNVCAAANTIEDLNQTCYCLGVDSARLRHDLAEGLTSRGLSQDMITTHPHLFSSVPMFVSRLHLERMTAVVFAIEQVVTNALFKAAALAWAPEIAHFDPKSRGGLLGYDFHLSVDGPKLIEINTNPGGALLNSVLAKAQQSCCRDLASQALVPGTPPDLENAVLQIFQTEWQLQRGDKPLKSIAIVDEMPQQQYLYPEFCLYENLFRRHGIDALICAPANLQRTDGHLLLGAKPIDFVYNRLTDFGLDRPEHLAIREAYLRSEVVVSPHPRAHALYADKRNLGLLGNASFLRRIGVSDDVTELLTDAIPATRLLTLSNREDLWTRRRSFFFKPAGGYGGKAAYRGDKLTRRVWEEMQGGIYVAQALVPPSERRVSTSQSHAVLKADVRCYAYCGKVVSVAARLYQGQTTNFRTPGGGFAPVFTEAPKAFHSADLLKAPLPHDS